MVDSDIKKKYMDIVDSTSTQQSSNANNYYEMSKQQEYATLLDKEIELENAKSNALKYTNNQMAAQGFASQGYGSSYNSGMSGRYLDALGRAQKDYKSSIDNLNYQQYQEKKNNDNDRFESITTMLSQASNIEQMNQLLSDYGYGSLVENDGVAEFQWNEKPEELTDDDWYQMQYYYNLQKSAIESMKEPAYNTYASIDALNNATFTMSDGNISTLGEHYAEEAKVIWHHASNGDYEDGATIMITNGEGDTIYMQWTSNGFKSVDKKTYNEASSKYTLTRGKDKNNIYKKVK